MTQRSLSQSYLPLTNHARLRMSQRGITKKMILLVLYYGRELYERGATIFALGHKEAGRYKRILNIDLSDCVGLQVLCGPSGKVLTVYRNHNFRSTRASVKRSLPKKTRSH